MKAESKKAQSRLLRHALSSIATLLIAGFAGAAMIRYGPGFDVDERDLDARYSAETRQAIHAERSSEQNIVAFYVRYLGSALRGDLGISRSLAVPVSGLITARAGVTLRLIGLGLLWGWTIGLSLALLSVKSAAVHLTAEAANGLCLSLPAAVLALLIFLARGPVSLVIGAAIFPRVFRNARDLFEGSLNSSQVLAARARGVAESRIFLQYIARPAASPLIALAGVCVSFAFGAAIPVEVICDLPGVGQLAWKAAVARDLPVLVALTLIVTAATVTSNSVADLVLEASAA